VSLTFQWIDTKGRYRPKLTSTDQYAESADEYCERIQHLLPRFPTEVLTQWFYEHWAQIDDYAWLGFRRLQFDRILWTSEEVMCSGIKDDQSVQVDHRHYENGVTGQRIERIASHFRSHGTWPVAPVFLANPGADIVRPDGLNLTSPYHLLEGHHRAGLFWSFLDQGVLRIEHEVWVANLVDA